MIRYDKEQQMRYNIEIERQASSDKKNIVLDKAIKTEGLFEVELKLYKGVSCKIKVSVKAK